MTANLLKILLSAFKLAQLASLEGKTSLELLTQKPDSRAYFDTYKRIFNWQS